MKIKRINKKDMLRHAVYITLFFAVVFVYLRVQEGMWQFVDSAFVAGGMFILTAAFRFCYVLDGFSLLRFGAARFMAAVGRRDIPAEQRSYAAFLKAEYPPQSVFEPLVLGAVFVIIALAYMVIV